MVLKEERISEIRAMIEKQKGGAATDEEVADTAWRMEQLANIAVDHYFEEQRHEKKLKESPKGFVLDGVGYTCLICHNGTHAGENWYDRCGIKCSHCQRAVNHKEIPASLAKHEERAYSRYDLDQCFNLKGSRLHSWVKKGIIKSRVIRTDTGEERAELFLIKDNEGFLPPKDLVKSRGVWTERDGQEWFRTEPWYRFVDPYEHLKGYGIMEYMKVTEAPSR